MALSEQQKQSLQKLRSEYPGVQNQSDIDSLERSLDELVESRAHLELPAFKRISDIALKKLNAFNALLLNDETLLNETGRAVSQERNLWRAMLSSFSSKETDESIRALEEVINTGVIEP